MDYKAINEAASMEAVLAAYGIRTDAHKKVALCPFHADKDPSLHVYAHGFYCFACGAGGDAIKFVQRMDGVSAADAARKVAEISGYGLPEHTRRPSALRARKQAEQLKKAGCEQRKELPFQREIMEGKLPYTIGGGIGQSRICMFFLKKAHIGEVQVSVWPEDMVEQCRENNIFLL